MSLCSKKNRSTQSWGSWIPPSGLPIKRRVLASCTSSPSLLSWIRHATVVVLHRALCSWSPLLSCCFCLSCLSKAYRTGSKHLPLPRLMEPSKPSRAALGDHLWSLPHFCLTLTFYDTTGISAEFSAGGVTLLAPLSFYISGCSAFEIVIKADFGSHM